MRWPDLLPCRLTTATLFLTRAGDKLLGRGRSWVKQNITHRKPDLDRLSIRWRVDSRNGRKPAWITATPTPTPDYVAKASSSTSRAACEGRFT